MKSEAWFFVVLFVVVLGIHALIWLPAISDCNAAGGELVVNAFNLPACVAGAN